jgi:hypothetical protein
MNYLIGTILAILVCGAALLLRPTLLSTYWFRAYPSIRGFPSQSARNRHG